MRVLIAEDEAVSRLRLQKQLEQWGHEVVATAHGAEAWSRFESDAFPMVITDWLMPEMHGIDLIRRIRARPEKGYPFVILLTALAETEYVVAGMEAGADDFVTKPFDSSELRARVGAGMRVVQLEQALVAQNRQLREEMDRLVREVGQRLPAAATAAARTTPSVGAEIRIVRAQAGDFDVVAQLFEGVRSYNATLDYRLTLADTWRDTLREQYASTHADPAAALWLLAWRDTQPVGLLAIAAHLDSPLLKHRRWAEVMALYVAPDCRGSGLARRLMSEAQRWAGEQGFDRVQVHAAATNETARSFYQRSGFQRAQEVLRLPVDPSPTGVTGADGVG
jgi:DNA-binding response OmpR family regulator